MIENIIVGICLITSGFVVFDYVVKQYFAEIKNQMRERD